MNKKNIQIKTNLVPLQGLGVNSPSGVRGSFFGLFFLFLSLSVFAQSSLYTQFKTPPAEAKPWTFWYWMHGAVSKEGIKADLKAMHEIGLGGAYLMPIRGVEGSTYPKSVSQLTPAWWEMVRYSFQVADSLGLKMGLHISDGFALGGGPWIKPAESMQKVVFSDTLVGGGAIKNLQLHENGKLLSIPTSVEGLDKSLRPLIP